MLVVPMFSCVNGEKGNNSNKDINESYTALEKQFMQHYELLGKSEILKKCALELFKNGIFDGSASSSCIAPFISPDGSTKYVTFIGMGEPISEKESDAYICPTSDAENSFSVEFKVHFPRPFDTVDGGRRNVMYTLGKELAKLAVKYDGKVSVGGGRFASTQVVLPPSLCSPSLLGQIRLGFDEEAYMDTRYKLKPSRRSHRDLELQRVTIVRDSLLDPTDIMTSVEQRINRSGDAIEDGVRFARDLVNSPSNIKTPPAIARMAEEFAQELGLECQVLGKVSCSSAPGTLAVPGVSAVLCGVYWL